MAEAQAEVCVACAQPVPITSNRRRFRSTSSSHVLPTLSEIIGRLDSAASSAILDPQGLPFVCRGCFSSLEKLKKVTAEASQIYARLESGVRRFSELLGRKDGASTIRAATARPQTTIACIGITCASATGKEAANTTIAINFKKILATSAVM